MLAIDVKMGGWSHDVLRPEVGDWLVDAVRTCHFDAVFLAPPCSSYSVRHPVKLRSRARPEGVQPLPAGWEAYVRKHNGLAAFTGRVVEAAAAAGVPVAIENPADRADDDSAAGWERHADSGSLWRMKCISEALQRAVARPVTFAQCGRVRRRDGSMLELGSPAQKWTTLAASPWLARELEALAEALCEHGDQGHAVRLEGMGPDGESGVLW